MAKWLKGEITSRKLKLRMVKEWGITWIFEKEQRDRRLLWLLTKTAEN